MSKIPLIINDFVVYEDVCNANCEYCLSDGAKLKEERSIDRKEGYLQFVRKPKDKMVYKKGSFLYLKLNSVLDKMEARFDTAILKISGGEILMIDGILDFIQERASHYATVQVLTNGILLNEEKIRFLASIPNVQVQFPLDGHTLEMNICRISSQKMQEHLLKNLDLLSQYNIPVEINCVLTHRNIDNIPEYLDYLLKYETKLMVFFLPVRFKPAERLFPFPDQIERFGRIIDCYPKYKNILPPLLYLEKAYQYLKTNKREIGCALPLAIIQSFDDGVVTPCANRWTTVLGNIEKEDHNEVLSKFGEDKIYKIMVRDPVRLPFCKQCYTPYDLINFYLFNLMDNEEIKKIALFNHEKVIKNLELIKKNFIGTHSSYIPVLRRGNA